MSSLSGMRSMITESSSGTQLDEKYFGKTSKKSFVDTYRQLKHQGELLVGGYQALDKLILQPIEKNVLAKTVIDLQNAGVITPRTTLGSIPERPEPILPSIELLDNTDKKGRNLNVQLINDDNESGTFLTKVGFHDDHEDDEEDEELGFPNHPEHHQSLTNLNSSLDSLSDLGGTFSHVMNNMTGIGEGSLDYSIDTQSLLSIQQQEQLEEEENSTTFSYRPSSPRAIFLNGCLKNKIPPITIALVRRNLTSTINLSHMGIGDKIASILADCLSSIPYLQVLDLSDNNLTDQGLSELLTSVSKHKEIEILDISNNIIGINAANALGAYLANPACRLYCLRLRDANIDDTECANICSVLKHNTCLKELDLSKNLLGKDENLNVVKPEFVTGGESLADLLLHSQCPIEKLVLHWNMIRLDGAIALCQAISDHKYLIHLDLSYNSIGSHGAEILGKSLLSNNILKYLNISHNNIDALGCFTLCIGIEKNTTLREFILDSNPVGIEGCKILAHTILNSSTELDISVKHCDFSLKHESVRIDITDCAGSYNLDMSTPYERAILLALLRFSAKNPNIHIRSLEMPSDTNTTSTRNSNNYELYTVQYETIKNDQFNEELKKEIELLTHFSTAAEYSYEYILQICKEYDLEDCDRFDISDLKHIFEDLNLSLTGPQLIEIKVILDPFQYKYIESRSFAVYLLSLAEKSTQLLNEIYMNRTVYIETNNSSSSGRHSEFVPPTKGIVKINVTESWGLNNNNTSTSSCSSNQNITTIRRTGLSLARVKRLINIAHKSNHSLQMLTSAVEQSIFYIEEAKHVFNYLYTILDDPVSVIAIILPYMASIYDANLLIKCCLGYDMKKIRRLKQKLGPIYNTITGLYNSFYSLDFSNTNSRKCWKFLLNISLNIKLKRKFDSFGELSQNGDGIYCFRNIHIIKPFPLPTTTSATTNPSSSTTLRPTTSNTTTVTTTTGNNNSSMVTDAERECILASLMDYSTVPRQGKLEFDFIHSAVPDFSSSRFTVRTLSDDSFIRIINACQLLEDRDIDATLNQLLQLMRQSRKMMYSTGYQYFTPSLPFAIATGEHLYNLYSNLPNRKKSVEVVSKRECITADSSDHPLHQELKIPSTLKYRFISTTTSTSSAATTMENANKSIKINKILHKFTTLISTQGKSIRLVSKNTWINNIRKLMLDPNPSPEYRSVHILEYLQNELIHRWIYCRQLSILISLYTFGCVSHSAYGSYRVELIISLFDRIVDLHNFQFVIMMLSSEEYACLLARIGILNMFNPCYPSGGLQLDMSRWDERQVVKMIIHLSTVEPGENFRDEEYSFDRNHVPMPGWELKVTWFQEDSLPTKGVLALEVYSGQGMGVDGCQVSCTVRNMLMCLVLPRQRDLYEEIQNDRTMTCLLIQDTATNFSNKENREQYSPKKVIKTTLDNCSIMQQLQPSNFPSSVPSPHNMSLNNLRSALLASSASASMPPSATQTGVHTPELQYSAQVSIATTSEVMLLDPVMQLAYPQLSVFEHYETGKNLPIPRVSTTGSPKPTNKRLSTDTTTSMIHSQATHWKQTGSSSHFMKTYRLEDLHTNLRAKTSINWTYAPLPSGSTGLASRATSRSGTTKGPL